jgi:putative restriction endonuclease
VKGVRGKKNAQEQGRGSETWESGVLQDCSLGRHFFGLDSGVHFTAYHYTCALTRYRLTTITAGTIVDAAHIHQFSRSRNNDPRNGLALCKNAHWLFDNGLWTISDDYKVIVAVGRFSEDSPDQKSLTEYHGRKLHLPDDPKLWPAPVHLAWHRKNRFQGL